MHESTWNEEEQLDAEEILDAPTERPASPTRKLGGWLLWLLPWVLLGVAVGYSVFLQSKITDGVYFSGDGGLKGLMTQQFAAGQMRFDLEMPAQPWVRALWDEGTFPFQPPFAYTIEGKTYTQYSYPFPLVSSPFYAWLGHDGLYVLPLLATWVLWIVFLRTCGALGLTPLATCGAFAIVAFASPLTFYSATFWEHTLAVSLAFFGLSRLLRIRPASGFGLFLGGASVGLATWFREELLCLVCALVLLGTLEALFRRPLFLGVPKVSRFFIGMLLLVATSFVLNTVIYGHFLGVHSFPVLQHQFSLESRLVNAASLFWTLSGYLRGTMPSVYFLLLTAVLLVAPERFLHRKFELFLLGVFVLFLGSVPLVLPDVKLDGDGGKQWGPRFLLLLVPLTALAGALALQRIWSLRAFGLRYALLLAMLVSIGVGVYRNVYEGTEYLADDYALRILPALRHLESEPDPNIGVRYQHIAQELRPSLPQKNFFLTGNAAQFTTLAQGLLKQDISRFLYLRYYTEAPPAPVPFEVDGQEYTIQFHDTGIYGIYTVYDSVIE